jgi:hypothetical protein
MDMVYVGLSSPAGLHVHPLLGCQQVFRSLRGHTLYYTGSHCVLYSSTALGKGPASCTRDGLQAYVHQAGEHC